MKYLWDKKASLIFSSQSEDIRLDPELYDPCKSDITRLCPNVNFGNAQVRNFMKLEVLEILKMHHSHREIFKLIRILDIFLLSLSSCSLLFWSSSSLSACHPSPAKMIECLKEQKKQLSQRCHQRIFRLQEVEMTDPELDYQLMRVCKQMIKVRWRSKGRAVIKYCICKTMFLNCRFFFKDSNCFIYLRSKKCFQIYSSLSLCLASLPCRQLTIWISVSMFAKEISFQLPLLS